MIIEVELTDGEITGVSATISGVYDGTTVKGTADLTPAAE